MWELQYNHLLDNLDLLVGILRDLDREELGALLDDLCDRDELALSIDNQATFVLAFVEAADPDRWPDKELAEVLFSHYFVGGRGHDMQMRVTTMQQLLHAHHDVVFCELMRKGVTLTLD